MPCRLGLIPSAALCPFCYPGRSEESPDAAALLLESPVTFRERSFVASRTPRLVVVLAALAIPAALAAQSPPADPAQKTPPSAADSSLQSSSNQCVEPEPLMSLEDYHGPFKKLAATLSRGLERKTAHHPHGKPGAMLCSLDAADKFRLFAVNTVEPLTFVVAGFHAGLDQAQNNDPQFGQGAAGHGKRFGAAYADEASANFFGTFLYPAIFHEDPRYYRLVHASGGRRLVHAMRHTFLAHSDSGAIMFNFSEWLGTASSASLSNIYHPGNRRGFGPTAENVAISISIDMGFDILREFLPDIFRAFQVPFIRPEHTSHRNKSASP